jgi:hypothetical protein
VIDALSFFFQSSKLQAFLLLVMLIGTLPLFSFNYLKAWSFPIIRDGNQCPFFFLSTFSKLKALNFLATKDGDPPPFLFFQNLKLLVLLLLTMAIHPHPLFSQLL